MKNHKIVRKLQLKHKLEYYCFFRLSPHDNRSLVFYRLKYSGGEVASRWDTTKVTPTPSLPQRMRLPRSEILSTPAETQKVRKKRPGYRSPTNSLEQVIPLQKSFCKYSSPWARVGLVWNFCFLSDKKANSYKTEFQFQVILPNREGFLDLGDIHYSQLIAKPFLSVEIRCKVWIIILTLCFYCSFSVYGERMFAFRRSNFVASKAVRLNHPF